MSFTAVQSAEGTLTQNVVTTVNFGTGASTPTRFSYVTISNDGGATPAPIYVSVNGIDPTIGGEDFYVVNPGATATLANGAGLWTQGLSTVAVGTQTPSSYQGASTPWQATPYGSSLAGGAANPGTTVKMISAQAVAFTVSGSG